MSEKSWKSFVAGASAGGIESFTTFPFEFAKTRLQLAGAGTKNPLTLIFRVAKQDGISSIYSGCLPFVFGNTAKAGVRFLGFDFLRNSLRDSSGNLSSGRGALAGLGAGVLESVFALTPGESIKTALIDDNRTMKLYSNKGFRGIKRLVQDRGVRVMYRGVVPVTARQAANSTVRLGSYSFLRTLWENRKHQKLNSLETFGLGSFVGVITVYSTMPIDVVKTRLQAINGQQYRSMLDCFSQIIKNEGVKTLWKGSSARLGRLVMSGGIIFTIYERIMVLLA